MRTPQEAGLLLGSSLPEPHRPETCWALWHTARELADELDLDWQGQSYDPRHGLLVRLSIPDHDPQRAEDWLAGRPLGAVVRLSGARARVTGSTDRGVVDQALREGSFFERCGRLAEVALLADLCRVHGYGCVTANGRGSHTDMDFVVMTGSFVVIREALRALDEETVAGLERLRAHGCRAEGRLLAATGGVNTYRGALFELLIMTAAAHHARRTGLSGADQLGEIAADFSAGLMADLQQGRASQASLVSWREHGQAGVRGDAVSGFAAVRRDYLPLLRRGMDSDQLMPVILQRTWDTTTIARGGVDALLSLQQRAGLLASEASRADLSAWCEDARLSTGGCADQLILTHYLALLQDHLLVEPGTPSG